MDEEVPDSDGEEYLPLQPKLVTPFTPAAAVPTDSISPFSAAKAVASTKDPISSSSSDVRPPRPRPKPTYKGAPGHPSNLAETSLIGSFSDSVPSSLSDRVKMRNRVVSKVSAPDSTSSSSHRPAVVSTDVIEIDSSEDELISNPKPKAASNKKPAAKSKGSRLTTSSSSSNVPMPSPRQPSPNLPTTIPFPSQLPPSDPFPQSTGMSRYHPEHEGDGEGSIPPIATLTAAGDTSFEPDSSPSRRKEKARPKPKPKPKKPKPPVPDSQDQLQYDFEADGFGGNRDTRMMPPPLDPPTIPLVIRLPPVARPSTSLTASASNPDTLPDLLTGAPSDKPPKKRKKKADDSDKEKPPKKPRVKKAKKDAEGGEAGGEDKSKKKGKGKEKEEFKSAEFITDEDDPVAPGDAAPLVPPPLPSLMDGVLGGASAHKPVSIISIPDSQADEEELVPLRKRKRATEEDEDNAADRNAEDTGKEATTVKKNKKVKTAGATVDKTKKKAPAKKAKGRTVLSDDEEDGAGGEAPVPFDTMVVNSGEPIPDTTKTDPPTQTGSDVGDEAPQAKVKPAKKKKVAKKTVVSESEDEGDEAFQNKPNVSKI
ncbi:hypothetical protein FB451DRAFT_1245505 [Mycena latifolia]|nr:hypothetical protein FB451DRAFT_1245505 [Mycena latifolia]